MASLLTLLKTLPRLWTNRRGRRLFDREAVVGQGQLQVGRRVLACRVANVSVGGALLVPTLGVRPGTEVILSLHGCPLKARARIVRVDRDGVGIAFDDDGVGAALAGWIKGTTEMTEPDSSLERAAS